MTDRIEQSGKKQIVLATIVGCIIFAFYARYALYINTVVEMPDEYGYLANAAYLSGTTWSSLTNLYYGWGYSLLLLPLFWIGAKGTTIIRGAILINALCTVATYGVQSYLMSKICKKLNRYVVILTAFVMSFYPYIMASNVKVLPETLVSFMVWLCGLILYKALESKRVYWYCLLALCMAYTFFVHTRTFVFIGVWIAVFALMALLKEIDWRHLLLFLLLFAIFYFIGYSVKDMLISNVYSNVVRPDNMSQETVVVQNIVPMGVIISKIKALFTDQILMFIYYFICRFFYIAVATLGTWQLGVYAIIKDCVSKWKAHISLSVAEWVKVSFVAASFMMVFAASANSLGALRTVNYFFYGRYYEYLILPVAVLGIEYFISTRIDWKTVLIHVITVLASAVGVFFMYLLVESTIVSIDTCRMPAFSALASGVDYRIMILGYLLIAVVALLVGIALNRRESIRWMYLLMVLAVFGFNNISISSLAVNMSEGDYPDNVLVDYVLEHVEEEQVYYLDSQYVVYTTRMQALLGKKQLAVINIDDLEDIEDKYLLAQTGSRYSEELKAFKKVMVGYYYCLYYVD